MLTVRRSHGQPPPYRSPRPLRRGPRAPSQPITDARRAGTAALHHHRTPPLPGGNYIEPTDLNDAGQVVGFSGSASGYLHAFLYSNGAMTDIDPGGGIYSTAYDINSSGTVVGYVKYDGAPPTTGSFLYASGMSSPLPVSLEAINDAGVGLGGWVGQGGGSRPNYKPRSFFYEGGVITPISVGPIDEETCGGFDATAFNNALQVVGNLYGECGQPQEFHPILYQDNQVIDLRTLGFYSVLTINNRGAILGQSTQDEPLVYDHGATPYPRYLGNHFIKIKDMNDYNTVVGGGFAIADTPHNYHGVIGRDGVLYDLNDAIPPDSGWVIRDAWAINNRGQILATAWRDFRDRPVLLTPTFADLPTGHPYRDAILALTARGIIQGYGDGRVGPDDPVLRAQSAALIARAVGWDAEDWPGTTFPDQGVVDDDLWRNVRTLAHYRVALGYEDGTYNPTGAVLEQQVILFIARAMIAKGYWVEQADTGPYPNLPNGTEREQADRRTIATYVYYTGAVPDCPVGQSWTTWDGPTTRGWAAESLWRALGTIPAP